MFSEVKGKINMHTSIFYANNRKKNRQKCQEMIQKITQAVIKTANVVVQVIAAATEAMASARQRNAIDSMGPKTGGPSL